MDHVQPASPVGSASSIYCTLRSQEVELHQQTCDLRARAPLSLQGFLTCAQSCPALGWRHIVIRTPTGTNDSVSLKSLGCPRCFTPWPAFRPYEKLRICIPPWAGGIPPQPMVRLQNCGSEKRNEIVFKTLRTMIRRVSCCEWLRRRKILCGKFVVGTAHRVHDIARTLLIVPKICVPSALAAFSRDD